MTTLATLLPIMSSLTDPAGAQPQPRPQPPAGWPAFTSEFRAYTVADGIVGASVVVMHNGRVTARFDTGDQDRAARIPAGERTIYHWGSITKSLTAIAIMQLREEGKIRLDDPVEKYLPWFKAKPAGGE